MNYNYSKLDGRITEKCGNRGNFASKINLSERSVSLKMNNVRGWKQAEIVSACNVLDIPHEDIPAYFFTEKVQN